MLSKGALTLDISEFVKRNKELEGKLSEAIVRGLKKAGARLAHDTVMEEPKVPLKWGTLRGSLSLHVEGKLVMAGNPERPGGIFGDPNTDEIEEEEATAVVGFNVPYATRLHEHPEFKFRTPGTGAFFLKAKMDKNQEGYFRIVAAEVEGALK